YELFTGLEFRRVLFRSTGHSYIVYGPLANRTTSVIYEGAPNYPDKDRLWEIIESYGVTIFYTAPTAIRAFMKWGDEYPARHDMRSEERRVWKEWRCRWV